MHNNQWRFDLERGQKLMKEAVTLNVKEAVDKNRKLHSYTADDAHRDAARARHEAIERCTNYMLEKIHERAQNGDFEASFPIAGSDIIKYKSEIEAFFTHKKFVFIEKKAEDSQQVDCIIVRW